MSRTLLKRFGSLVKKRRKQKKMTLRELSIKSGVPTSTIWQIEKGISNPLFLNQYYIAMALGVNLSELLAPLYEKPTRSSQPEAHQQ